MLCVFVMLCIIWQGTFGIACSAIQKAADLKVSDNAQSQMTRPCGVAGLHTTRPCGDGTEERAAPRVVPTCRAAEQIKAS
jgi:hypothetical protein